ncbi:MAG TPA: DegT/DnrJ/EryC1/StrS family aminotransferase [Polyangiaceae bacterium]|jgi:perosamine synthetase|nr:DegT/DnrJ/EryC1/StrS family aminotransferase [Polyangiaceae bacterium]
MTESFIPVCEPLLLGRELEYVSEAVSKGWISSSGSFVNKFEARFSEHLGVRHSVTVSNGTAALHLALVAAGVGPGDEVIVPTFTMIASAAAVCYAGATPVFVDCERDTFNLDVQGVEAKLTERTRAIMPVHIYGLPCDMDPLLDLGRRHGLVVVEDAAEAIGSLYKGRACGALGELGCFSFFANKVITTGEGGMVVTNDDALAEKLRYYKNLCFPLGGPRRYVHEHIGFNYRMPNTSAAIGLAQLERVEDYVTRRRENARRYNERLAGQRGITIPVDRAWARNSFWMYSILIEDDFGLPRDRVMALLGERGIETRSFFVPMHQQRGLAAYGCDVSGSYPNAEHVSPRGLYLPSGSGLSEEQIERVCRELIALRP